MPDYRYVYTVAVKHDGTLLVEPSVGDATTVERTANLYDIADSARKLSTDMERRIQVEEIVAYLAPTAPAEPADAIREALKGRGITPETPSDSDSAPAEEPVN